jgi:hypothetical protein
VFDASGCHARLEDDPRLNVWMKGWSTNPLSCAFIECSQDATRSDYDPVSLVQVLVLPEDFLASVRILPVPVLVLGCSGDDIATGESSH